MLIRKNEGFTLDDPNIEKALSNFLLKIENCQDVTHLLLVEAQLTKSLYKIAANHTQQKDFVRQHNSLDDANAFLNHGNYLAYGLAATTLWVLGIPHGFAVMHGKTRRGALVFDIADLIKDTFGHLSVLKNKPQSKNFANNACKTSPSIKPWILCLM